MGCATTKERKLFTGNHAIVRGAWEAGVTFAAGYPGTPATEIIEIAGEYDDIHAQWGANEKVAFDVAMGYAINGKRALVSMKYVGLNVAADSFMVMPFGGTVGGFVIVSADDPGMHSSQNEQDNRYFAKIAKMPMIEPSDAQEAKDYLKFAYEVSEQFSTPVLFRTSMRINHTKCVVEMGERQEFVPKTYEPDIPKWVVPVFAKSLRPRLDEKMERLAGFSETFPLNRIEEGTGNIGVITSGISYQYAKEVFPDATFFKLAMTYPLPKQKIIDFCKRFDKVYVVEELEPFMEEQIRFWGVSNIIGKDVFPITGELSVEVLEEVLHGIKPKTDYSSEFNIMPRPPQICAGCPHRGAFLALKKLKAFVTGDIGCYTLGCLPPMSAVHTVFCMGASIGNAAGFEKAGRENVVAVIGDSTFVHGGIPSLIDVVYNGGKTTTIILDNRTTGMTGHQDHPATGRTVKNEEHYKLDLEKIVRAIGVECVIKVDPYNMAETTKGIKEAMEYPGPAVVITTRPCIFQREEKARVKTPLSVVEDDCISCGACTRIGCPALPSIKEGEKAKIDPISCVGCSVCTAFCSTGAIVPGK